MTPIATKFADWLADPVVDPATKVEHCLDVLRLVKAGSDSYSLEAVGKSVCHLVYRVLESPLPAGAELFELVEFARLHVKTMGRETKMHQSRWFGSITMALVFLNALKAASPGEASKLANDLVLAGEESITALPQNAVNVMRACLLRAAWHCKHDKQQEALGYVDKCQRFYKQAVAAFALEKGGIMRGDELITMAKLAKLSIGIRNQCTDNPPPPVFPWGQLAAIDMQEPFCSTFITMSPKA